MNTRQLVYAIVLLVLTTLTHVQAQFSVEGKVQFNNGDAIKGVSISLSDHSSMSISDSAGYFSFRDVKAGNYTLSAHLAGYENQSFSLIVQADVKELHVVLNPIYVLLEKVEVAVTRANEKTPTTYTNLNEKQLKSANFGQDLPYLLESTPSTVVTSDAGGGVGYTGVRIRGVDPTRTNVTINGIPMNDAESHGVYWVNMPDFASSTDNIQVQRGVGTSTNGVAAFGASINIKTDNIKRLPYAELDNSVGTFSTLRNTLKAGTGLLNKQFTLDMRLSAIRSDGYIDRAASDLKAYSLSGAWIGKKSLVTVNVFSGKEQTYQAWNGIPGAKLSGNQDSLLRHYNNNRSAGGAYQDAADSINLFSANPRTYNYYTYKNEVDNYQQNHYQVHFTHTFSPKWALNVATHFTHGEGYYEQYKKNEKFATYRLDTLFIGADTISKTDLIRRRWLNNNFYGAIFSVTYNNLKSLTVIAGGGLNRYDGTHYGEIIWAKYASQSQINQHYYDNTAQKVDGNLYVKANYQLNKWNFFADMQVRQLNYSYLGYDQSYNNLIPLQQNVHFTFFNPKAGLMIDLNPKNNLYASIAIANREPVRDDFIQSTTQSRPHSENLQNLEVGYRFRTTKWTVNATYYWMNYTNQLILTGKINDVGAYNRTNVAASYRMGIELEAGYKLFNTLTLSGNATFSANKIRQFDEYVDNYDAGKQTIISHTNTDIAFSPTIIASVNIAYSPIPHWDIALLSKYVGQQFLDNTSSNDRKLNAYYISNLSINYSTAKWGVKQVKIGVLVNNLFDYLYENNGYTWGYISGGRRIVENFYYPQAGRNILLRVTIGL